MWAIRPLDIAYIEYIPITILCQIIISVHLILNKYLLFNNQPSVEISTHQIFGGKNY